MGPVAKQQRLDASQRPHMNICTNIYIIIIIIIRVTWVFYVQSSRNTYALDTAWTENKEQTIPSPQSVVGAQYYVLRCEL